MRVKEVVGGGQGFGYHRDPPNNRVWGGQDGQTSAEASPKLRGG